MNRPTACAHIRLLTLSKRYTHAFVSHTRTHRRQWRTALVCLFPFHFIHTVRCTPATRKLWTMVCSKTFVHVRLWSLWHVCENPVGIKRVNNMHGWMAFAEISWILWDVLLRLDENNLNYSCDISFKLIDSACLKFFRFYYHTIY